MAGHSKWRAGGWVLAAAVLLVGVVEALAPCTCLHARLLGFQPSSSVAVRELSVPLLPTCTLQPSSSALTGRRMRVRRRSGSAPRRQR